MPMNSRLPLLLASAALASLSLGGCLSAGPVPEGNESETSSDSDTTTSGETTTTTDGTSTTMTTTSTTMTSSAGVCGDGNVDAGEECDDGAGNSDDAACTANCMNNVCGDGLVLSGAEECDDGNEVDTDNCTAECKNNVCGDGILNEGVEICDDGVNDGSYGGCMDNCAQLGPYCGDTFVDADNEECDDPDFHSGCLPEQCVMATSCLEIKNAVPEAETGIYTIAPAKEGVEPLDVWCEMEADGGGYTMVKVNHSSPNHGSEAEEFCATYGMKFFVPRTEAHLLAAFDFAVNENLAPLHEQEITASKEFLTILAVYPTVPGEGCVDVGLNSDECPEYQANDGGPYWVTDQVWAGQPGASNCSGCTALYEWNDDGTLKDYQFFAISGGGDWDIFLCHMGDKQ